MRRRALLYTSGKNPGYITVNPTPNTLTYNGTAQELVSAGSGSGTILYSIDNLNFYNTIPTSTNAGDYIVYYKAAESGGFFETEVYSVSCTISKAAGYVSTAPSAKSLTYTGNALELVNVGSGSGTMYYSTDNTNWSTSVPTGIDATTYTVYYKVAEASNYTESASYDISVTIDKASPSYTAPTANALTYNGNAQYLITTGSTSHGTIQYSADDSSWSTTRPTGTNAGSYTSYWKLVGDTNHSDTTSASISTTIAKAAGSVTTAPANTGYAYNGTARALASAGAGTGTMYYRLGTSGNFTTSIPTASAPGSWTLYYYAAASTNYNLSSTGSITVTQVKANQNAPTATGATVTYGSTATATASGGGGQGSIGWSNGNTRTAVGSQSTQARWGGNTYYNASAWSNSVTLTVNKAAGSVTTKPTAKSLTYTGKAQTLANEGSGTGTMYYRLGTSGSFSTTIPSLTNAGSWTLYYYAAASTNYNLSSTGSITVTISKKNSAISFSGNGSVGVGSTMTKTASRTAGDGTITYSSSNTNIATVNNSGVVTGVAVGSCTITATTSATTNYNSASASYTLTVAHEYVDLGLSVKWAKYNIGATSETAFGSFFTWGNVTPHKPGVSSPEEYNNSPGGKLNGNIPANATYDAARANWGGSWRLPTGAEMKELMNNCTCTIVTKNGVAGLLCTKNGKSIFFPAAGQGMHSGYCNSGERVSYPSSTYFSNMYCNGIDGFTSGSVTYGVNDVVRYELLPVRAVQ